MRFDWNINDSTRWFARYSIRDEFVLQNGSLPLPANGGNGQTIDLPGQNWASALNSNFGSTMFNELRFGYTFFPTRFDISVHRTAQREVRCLGRARRLDRRWSRPWLCALARERLPERRPASVSGPT